MNINKATLLTRKAFQNLGADFWLNVVTVVVIALSMTLVGAFTALSLNVSTLVDRFSGQVEVLFFLHDHVGEQQALALLDRIREAPEVAFAEYVSKDKAMERFRQQLAQMADVAGMLDENPLPASIETRLSSTAQDIGALERFAKQWESAPEIEEAYYGREWVERLMRIEKALWGAGVAIGLFLSGTAIFIIATTLKLAIRRRKEEIEVMRLVGATNRFIQAPFIIEGMLQGLFGAMLAMGALYAVFLWIAQNQTQDVSIFGPMFPGFTLQFLSPTLMAGFVGIGAILGLVGSLFSVGKFLKV